MKTAQLALFSLDFLKERTGIDGNFGPKTETQYAEAGTALTINRDRSRSAQLESTFREAGLSERPTDAGRQFLFGYVSGELG